METTETTENALVETPPLRLASTSDNRLQNGVCVLEAVDEGHADNIQKGGTTKPENSSTLGKKMAHKVDAIGKIPGNIIVPTRDKTPYVNKPCSELSRSGEQDKGPWSREAFDLFDWKPNSSAVPLTPKTRKAP
jgi:hypothetical protein